MDMAENGIMKMPLWFEEEMNTVMSMNNNVRQKTGLRPCEDKKCHHAAQYATAIAPYGLRLTVLRIAPYRV